MKAQTTTSLVILGEKHFDHGYSCGRLWYFNGDPLEKPVTWDDVVEFIVIIPISWLIRTLADQ